MERFLWICIGGAAGTGARYLVSIWAAQRLGTALPFGTLIVNLTGCFLIAAFTQITLGTALSPTLRAAVTSGVLGGFTTYSSFNIETTRLLQDGATAAAGLYALATIVGAFVAGWAGHVAGRQLAGG